MGGIALYETCVLVIIHYNKWSGVDKLKEWFVDPCVQNILFSRFVVS